MTLSKNDDLLPKLIQLKLTLSSHLDTVKDYDLIDNLSGWLKGFNQPSVDHQLLVNDITHYIDGYISRTYWLKEYVDYRYLILADLLYKFINDLEPNTSWKCSKYLDGKN